jgi:pimeloyl-ACP methyl ester carboxylesterase
MRNLLIRTVMLLLLPNFMSADNLRLQQGVTSEGIAYGWVGAKPTQPAPTVFFFGGAIEDSLTRPHYLEAVEALGADVWCVTIDLPCHGRQRRPDEPPSLAGWRYRFERDEDVTADLVRSATAVLNYLVAESHTDPSRVAVLGTSRGGFMAFHFAAADPRVQKIVGFSPVTDLFALSEFAGLTNNRLARSRSAANLAEQLRDRRIWLTIGNSDHRVSTQSVFDFVERVIAAAETSGSPPEIELHVQPSNGHAVPAGAYGAAACWLRRDWGLPELKAARLLPPSRDK